MSATTPTVKHQTSVFAVLLAGVICVVLADYAPRLINGLLVLILAGVLVNNHARWEPWVTGIAASFAGGAQQTGAAAGAPAPRQAN